MNICNLPVSTVHCSATYIVATFDTENVEWIASAECLLFVSTFFMTLTLGFKIFEESKGAAMT